MRLLLLPLLLLALSAPARAAEKGDEDLSSLFCAKMSDKSLYDKHNLESYKMLLPGNGGWIFRTSTDLMADFSPNAEALKGLRDLNAAFRRRGIVPVMLFVPTRGMMHGEHLRPGDVKKYNYAQGPAWDSYNAAAESIRKTGFHAVTLPRPEPGTPFFYKRDHHWTPDGARIAAKALADHVKILPEYADIPKTAFTTRAGEPADFTGVSKKVFQKLCGTRQQPERITRAITERADGASGAEDLFGDPAPPQIVLLGTSNSTPEPSHANFAGFLKEALSADILNLSVSGGGLDTAMISWLASDDYKKTPVKIALWELPGYYALSKHGSFFREAVPAVYGACAATKALAGAPEVRLDEKNTIALTKLADKDIRGESYYLYLGFPRPVTRPFSVSLLHGKEREKFRFAHATPYPQDREFYLRLDGNMKTPLDKVVLTVQEEMIGGTVDVRLCRLPGKDGDIAARATLPADPAGPVPGEAADSSRDDGGIMGFLRKLGKI